VASLTVGANEGNRGEALNPGSAWRIAKAAIRAWSHDYAPSMGAALAYYTMFSIAPLLMIVIALAGLVFGVEAARGELLGQLQQLMGEEGAKAIESMLASVRFSGESIPATLLSGGLLLVGATGVFCELQDNLDRIWRAPRSLANGIWALLRARLLSFGMILGIAFLLLVSLAASAALAALGKMWRPYFGGWELMAHMADIVLSLAMITLLFAMIYKIMPRVRIAWTDVWTGAFLSAVFFSIGKVAIGLYIGKSSFSSTFGAAGSLVVMLVWVYYSAQIFLLGAEFTRVYSHTNGSRCGRANDDRAIPAQAPPAGEVPSQNAPSAIRSLGEPVV
jgi:membrane protein